MGTRAWGQGLQGASWQPHSPERAAPRTERLGSAGPQPTLHHSILAAVPRALRRGLRYICCPSALIPAGETSGPAQE